MKIIDSHVHFWNPAQLRYLWLDELAALKRPFLPADYQEATNQMVSDVVFVQADCLPEQGLAEVDWVAGLGEMVRAIVAFAPLELGEAARPHLAQLQERPLVKGVRRLIQSEAADFAVQPEFVRGVQLLAEYDFRFDICIKHHQLTAVIELVRQCPNIPFVLDHIGKPDIAKGEFIIWQKNLSTLAQFENVYCKLSGVITEADWAGWTVREIRPYLEHTIASFGINRVMFGSDWPVVNLAGSFTKWFDALSDIVQMLRTEEKEKLFHQNAAKFYGIALDG